ncbi:MAG: septum formation inhibitor Maf [Nitrospirae bacterium]|nr:septum formation inhibitor Maf [Nitrospirota bacterium]
MSEQRTIILASASPRRKELLSLIGLKFRVDVSDYEEDLGLKLKPHELAQYLSFEKARAVADKHRDAVIIAADTFIVFRGKLLGKPHTHKEAMRMLTLLNGKSHSVITGYTVFDTNTGKKSSRSIETKVWFRKMADAELRAYVRTEEPLDKAGAYAIQGIGSLIVKKIEGDYFNVIGLPVSSLAATLKKFGINVLDC